MLAGIKVALPCESASGRCFLQLYIETILALQVGKHSTLNRDSLRYSDTPLLLVESQHNGALGFSSEAVILTMPLFAVLCNV